MTKNEKKFIKFLLDGESDTKALMKYVKENFNIDSEYNEDDMSIKLSCSNANESLQLLAAREYIENNKGSIPLIVSF